VEGLPSDLPQGTPVKVIFKYETDGRLAVRAELPTASCDAQTMIKRAVGMSREQLDAWSERLATGLVIEENRVPDEPVDVDEIPHLLDDDEDALAIDEDAPSIDLQTSAGETEPGPPPSSDRGTGDEALDDFLKGIG
jgi:hypothetical protein